MTGGSHRHKSDFFTDHIAFAKLNPYSDKYGYRHAGLRLVIKRAFEMRSHSNAPSVSRCRGHDFPVWGAQRELPDSLLHPQIAAECMTSFRAGKYATAVFEAFKALEDAMRNGAGLGHNLRGTKLAARAFNPNDGLLSNRDQRAGERQALMNLISGAVGYFKNPQSHRKVDLAAWEAREMLVVASHLFRIVEVRSLV